MRKVAALASAEIRRHVFVFLGGILLSVMPFLVTGHGAWKSGADTRDFTANFLALMLGIGVAAFLGQPAMLELDERRLGFLFSRPFSAVSIWAGKFLGGLVVVYGSVLLALLPVTISGGGLAQVSSWAIPPAIQWLPLPRIAGWEIFVAIAIILAVVFWISQVIGMAIRAGSPWLLVDALAIATAFCAIQPSFRRLLFSWAMEPLDRDIWACTIAMSVGLALASFLAVRAGRSRPREWARPLSLVICSTLISIVVMSEAYSRWVVTEVTPKDLVRHEIFGTALQPAPTGDWIIVSGNVRGRGNYEPHFLWNVANGRYFHIGDTGFNWALSGAFSPDGNEAAWLRLAFGRQNWAYQLYSIDLRNPTAMAAQSKRIFSGEPPQLVLSDDHSTLAAVGAKSISILRLPAGSITHTVELPPVGPGIAPSIVRAHFLDPDRLLLIRPIYSMALKAVASVDLFELAIARGKLTPRGNISMAGGFSPLVITNAECSQLLLRAKSRLELHVYDVANGAQLAQIPPSPEEETNWGTFLSDGRLVVVGAGPRGARLRLFSSDFRQLVEGRLGVGRRIHIGGQPDAGHLYLSIGDTRDGPPTAERLVLVDLSSGVGREVARHLSPVLSRTRWSSPDPGAIALPGSIATRLFQGDHDDLILLDPETGARKPIIPGK